jgi:preprotein translocase subunit SecG
MQILNIFHVLLALGMVILILVQRGAGATAGAAFGSGASGTVFGARGAGNFLTRLTATFATLFFAISMTMAVVASNVTSDAGSANESVISDTVEPAAEILPDAVDDIPTAIQEQESDLPVPANTGEEEGGTEEAADNS